MNGGANSGSQLGKRFNYHYERIMRFLSPRVRLINKAKIAAQAATGPKYRENPKLSLVLQSFNHKKNVRPIAKRLQQIPAELIICEDGSTDGALESWLKLLHRPNDFLIRSNDLHEIRTYSRAIGLAGGEFVCVLQDDDIPPENGDWASGALELFDRHKNLAVLGGYEGKCFRSNRKTYGQPHNKHQSINRQDVDTGIPFTFIDAVNIGPVFYRKSSWVELGGFDHTYSLPGKPGIGFDYEICLRAWLGGFEVGLFATKFQRHVGGRGSYIYATEPRRIYQQLNKDRILMTYQQHFDAIGQMVDQCNRRLVEF